MRSLILLFLFCEFLSNNILVFAEKKAIKIGSGSILEGYYSVALTICDYIKKSNKEVSCEVIPTNGSRENLNLLKDSKIDLALVQSNIAVDAFGGKGAYATGLPNLSLRQVLNLYDEIFTVIAKDDDKIKVFADIGGKRISNGNPESASTITYDAVRSQYSFAKPIDVELSHEDYAKQLCSGDIDVVMLVTGHPNALVSHIANSCEIDFVAIEREKLYKILESNRAYRKVVLAKDTYPGITADQETIGVEAILVTTDKFDSQILKNFEDYFDKNIEAFKQSNIILSNIKNNHFFEDFVIPKHENSKDIIK